MGVKVFYQEFSDYVSQKNAALAYARNNWVLSLDADEALTPALLASIKQVLREPVFVAYECNRLTNYCGKWIKHCGWYPDRKIRLFDKTKGKWVGQKVHEYWQADDEGAKTGRLKGDLLHFSYTNLSQHIRKTDSFTSYQAENILNQGKIPTKLKLIYKPFWSFFTSYFIRLGFLEGGAGLIISMMAGYSTFAKLAKARMMFENKNGNQRPVRQRKATPHNSHIL